MVNSMTMDQYMRFLVLWIIIPAVSLNQNHIYLSKRLTTARCQKINNTIYECSSLSAVFQQLSNCTDISIEPGIYNLTESHNLTDLYDIRITSKANTVIQCTANVNATYDFDTGIAFLRVRNLSINNITIVGCGMKHVTTNHKAEKFVYVRSALFIQNSTNISLDNITVSESNGIGLLIYDTNGSINITKSSFVNNSLNSLEQSKSLTGGGGVYIKFTECAPGFLHCDSKSNHFNISIPLC